MEQQTETACYCFEVEYRPVLVSKDVVLERWVCKGCGAEFARAKDLTRHDAEFWKARYLTLEKTYSEDVRRLMQQVAELRGATP